jgi:hypothetical protein
MSPRDQAPGLAGLGCGVYGQTPRHTAHTDAPLGSLALAKGVPTPAGSLWSTLGQGTRAGSWGKELTPMS